MDLISTGPVAAHPDRHVVNSQETVMPDFPEFIRRLPDIDIPLAGVTGQLLQGDKQQVVFLEASEDTPVPEHSHRAQWELVIAGKVDLTIRGEKRTYRAGDSFYIPEGIPHSALVYAGFRSVIFFDQTDRYRVLDSD